MRYLLIFVIIMLCGCATTVRDWEEAEQLSTIESYEQFLQKHPDAEQANQARLHLDRLQADKAWSRATSTDTIDGYKGFIDDFPKSEHTDQAKACLEELQANETWSKISSSNTISEYKDFIEKFPKSIHVDEASSHMEQLQLEKDWEQTKTLGSIYSYSTFIQKHPKSKQVQTAKLELERLEAERDWMSIYNSNSIGVFEKFIASHGNSEYTAQAHKKLILLKMNSAVAKGDVSLLEELLPGNQDFVNSIDSEGNMPLLTALKKGQQGVAKLLIEKGADVNAKDKDGWTPLIHASARDMGDVMSLLVKKGADVNASTKTGETSLHRAAGSSSYFLGNRLTEGKDKLNLDAQKDDGLTPLMYAVLAENYIAAEWLIKNGANIELNHDKLGSPFDIAATNKKYCMGQLLLHYGASQGDTQLPPPEIKIKDSIAISGYVQGGIQRYLSGIKVGYSCIIDNEPATIEYLLIPKQGLFWRKSDMDIQIGERSSFFIIGYICRQPENSPAYFEGITDIIVSEDGNLFTSRFVSELSDKANSKTILKNLKIKKDFHLEYE